MSEPNVSVFHRQTVANRAFMLFAATRPAFLSASVLPVLVAGALALAETGRVDLGLLVLASVNIALIGLSANVLNDYFDSLSGTDARNVERVFPFSGGSRFIQNGVLSEHETLLLGVTLTGLGAALGLYMAWLTGPLLLAIGLLGGALSVFYTAPPCLACRGLGDAAVTIAFGILPLAGTSLILTGEITAASLWLGAAVGCFVEAILWVNSIPDIAADRASGKMTLPVRFGPRAAMWGLPLWFLAGFLLLVAAPAPRGALIALGALVPAVMASRAAVAGRLAVAMPLTILTQAGFCVLLIAGLLIFR